MEKKIRRALSLERRAQQCLAEVKADIAGSVGKQDLLPGVRMITQFPLCAEIRFSALQKSNLAPSTYMPAAQVDAVQRGLASNQTVLAVLTAVSEMTEKKAVHLPSGERVTLNVNTIRELLRYKGLTDPDWEAGRS